MRIGKLLWDGECLLKLLHLPKDSIIMDMKWTPNGIEITVHSHDLKDVSGLPPQVSLIFTVDEYCHKCKQPTKISCKWDNE
jgi:hypothetical protein